MTEDVQLHRDPEPVLVCACSHVLVEHRTDVKTEAGKLLPCGRAGCGCVVFRPVERRWRWHGWQTERIRHAEAG